MTDPAAIRTKVNQRSQVLDIFSTSALIEAWQNTTGKKVREIVGGVSRFAAGYASPVLDVHTAVKLIKDLGVEGKVVLKSVNGRQYVIFKGYAGNRSIFSGTRYLANNPKVVDMAISKVGVNRTILSGARLTIFLVVPMNVLNYILSDQRAMSSLIGTTATDLVKVGASAAIASLAATATATLTTLAVGPLVVAIAVGVVTAYTLDALDRQFGVTAALIRALDDAYDSTVGEFGRQLYQVEKRLKWQLVNGQNVGEGIFY